MASNTRELRALARKLRAARTVAPQLGRLIIAKTALDTETLAKQLAPVDTGALRDSIGHTVSDDGLSAEIGTTVSYAPYLEFGTYRMAPQPYLNPAADVTFPKAEQAFLQLLDKLL